MEDTSKALALLCKAYSDLYKSHEDLKKSTASLLESISEFNKELDRMPEKQEPKKWQDDQHIPKFNTTILKDDAKACEFCGQPISKPKRRFCSTACQVSQMHKEKGHNVRPHKTPKPAPAPAAPEPEEENKPGK